MSKKKDYDKKVPGQQFEEIQDAQRKHRQQGHDAIDNIEKSKQKDREELDQLGNDALDKLRHTSAE